MFHVNVDNYNEGFDDHQWSCHDQFNPLDLDDPCRYHNDYSRQPDDIGTLSRPFGPRLARSNATTGWAG